MIPVIDVKATGENIKKLMKNKGVTPAGVRDWCGFASVAPVYHWMNGRNLPTVDNLLIL